MPPYLAEDLAKANPKTVEAAISEARKSEKGWKEKRKLRSQRPPEVSALDEDDLSVSAISAPAPVGMRANPVHVMVNQSEKAPAWCNELQHTMTQLSARMSEVERTMSTESANQRSKVVSQRPSPAGAGDSILSAWRCGMLALQPDGARSSSLP